jgi:hypothetical protein
VSSKTATNNNNTSPQGSTSHNNTIIAEWERKRPAPRPKKCLLGEDQKVREIHLMTGTLFMYRGGKYRRVEYVPRV